MEAGANFQQRANPAVDGCPTLGRFSNARENLEECAFT
jgi:hypothetical protein